MIKLKNIKRTSGLIECDILPEDSREMGHMAVDADKKEVVECRLPDGYEWCSNHVDHARDALLKMLKNDDFRHEKTVVWC